MNNTEMALVNKKNLFDALIILESMIGLTDGSREAAIAVAHNTALALGFNKTLLEDFQRYSEPIHKAFMTAENMFELGMKLARFSAESSGIKK